MLLRIKIINKSDISGDWSLNAAMCKNPWYIYHVIIAQLDVLLKESKTQIILAKYMQEGTRPYVSVKKNTWRLLLRSKGKWAFLAMK